MNRSARREAVFLDDATCATFLMILGDLPARFGVVIHGYALMPNHFHLLLECPRGNLSRAMRYLGATFTAALNRAHAGWDGPVFRGRFKNRVVERDDYWRHLLAYLHLNPVRAHLAPSLDQSYWTSHRAYVGTDTRPEWLHVSDLLDLFGGVEGYRKYAWELHVGRRPGPNDFDPETLWAPRKTERLPAPLPEPRTSLVAPEEALAQVCAVVGTDRAVLERGRRGARGNPARWLAAWWLDVASGLPQNEIGDLLGADGPTVSRWLHRVRAAGQRPQLAAWRTQLLGSLAVAPEMTIDKS
jgi:REP element-mobilizing transposase RayT